MKPCYLILSAAIPLLSSCASYQKTADADAWNIRPVFNVRHSTETPESFYQLGRYYQGQNRLEPALAAYQKSLAIDGKFAEARNGLGVVYAMQGKQQEALEQFRLAVMQAPNAAHIQNNLGYALYLSGSYAEAASALQCAVALNPANQAAHINLALALDKSGDREKAVQVMVQAAQQQSAVSQVAQVAQVAQVPQQVLALPKEWGVITQSAPVSVVESRFQVVQLGANVSELRARAQVKMAAVSVAKPIRLASVPHQQKPVVAAAHRLVMATEIRDQTARPALVAKQYRIEVSNGNGVTGMAKKVAGFLGGAGYSRTHLTNQKPFHVVSSQVQYRAGYREQAQSLAMTLPRQPGIVQSDNLRGNISVRVVLGKDLTGNVAYFEKNHSNLRLARY